MIASDLLSFGLKRISPRGVKSYLESHQWSEIDTRQTSITGFGNGATEVFLPMDRSFTDFELRLAQLILKVASRENRSPESLFQDLLFSYADVMRRRNLDNISERGTIPLNDVTSFYDAWKRALAEIALTTGTGKQNAKSRVDDFLASCQAGQTERGSFVGTVICPLYSEDPFGPNVQPMLDLDEPLQESFPRLVTSNFIDVLRSATSAVQKKEIQKLLDSNQASLITPKFCEAVRSMIPENDGTVEFSVGWSPLISVNEKHLRPVSLSRNDADGYEKLAAILRPHSANNERQEFIGRVEQLTAKTGDDLFVAGTVRLAFLYEGKAKLAKIELGHLNYLEAIHAHEKARSVFLTGVLLKATRISTITDVDDFRIVQA